MTSPALFVLFGLLSFAQLGYPVPAADVSDPVIDGLVKVQDDIRLPAMEGGVLVHLAVEEGSLIRAGQNLGQIDDSMQRKSRDAAHYTLQGAIKRGKDDVEIRFAEAKSDAAKADFDLLVETNKIAAKTVTVVEMRAKELEWKAAQLSIEKAGNDRDLARIEAYAKKAELEAADLAIQRRVITAPFDGMVEHLYRKQSEWVSPGDPILHLFRLDVMDVEGSVEQDKYDPHELQGCDVTVEVKLARGRKETVRGRITFVSSVVRGDGVYDVRAEVANRQEHGTWLLRDGMPSTMTIHLGTGGAAGITRKP